jgi:arylsulfatase A-like enzyme
MTLTLPETNRAADEAERSAFVFTGEQIQNQEGGASTMPIPFYVPKAERRMAPAGMHVWVDGEEASFLTALGNGGRAKGPVWSFRGEDLWVRAGQGGIGAQSVKEVKVVNPNVLLTARRLNWAEARADGMTDQQFVRYGMSTAPPATQERDASQQSREGLLLPAPATATWADLTLPEGAMFSAYLGMVPPPLDSASDGAEVVLVWTDASGERELDRQTLPGRSASFVPWKLDLGDLAGKTGTLTLRTLVGGNAIDDYVFVGSPAVVGKAAGGTRHVVVIGVDTLRPDHLGVYGYDKPTSPEIDAWAKDAVTFDHSWTSAPRTRPSFRAATTGRLPLDAVCAKNIGGVFDDAGYATAGIVANPHLNPRFDFQAGFDMWWLDGDAKADDQINRALDWLKEQRGRDTYLFLHLMDPHLNYIAPKSYVDQFTKDLPPFPDGDKLPPPGQLGRSQIYGMMARDRLTDLDKRVIQARYDAEIAYTSHELGRLFDYLDSLDGETVVVLHSDHGEEFWEHGGFEHNHQIYDDTTRGVLIIRPPGGTGGPGMHSDAPSTLQDIGPTLYALAGLKDTPATDGVDLSGAMRGEPFDPDRAIPIAHIQYEADRWGIVWKGHKYILWTGTGRQELYDLTSDPGETKDLAATVDTKAYWEKLGIAHHIGVGEGWRVEVDLAKGATLDIQLPAKAESAFVLDPELITHSPVNQEWGEVPPVQPDEVAAVTLSEDGQTVHVVAGSKGKGTLVVRFGAAAAVNGVVVRGAKDTKTVAEGTTVIENSTLTFKPGVVIVPPESEFDRMQQCVTRAGSVSERQMLERLGYMSSHPEGSGAAPKPDGHDRDD